MSFDPNSLLIFHLFGGFVVLLLWAALVGEAVVGRHPRWVRRAIVPMSVLGLVHPAAAIAAVDLARLGRSNGTDREDGDDRPPAPPFATPTWLLATSTAVAAISVVATTSVWLAAVA